MFNMMMSITILTHRLCNMMMSITTLIQRLCNMMMSITIVIHSLFNMMMSIILVSHQIQHDDIKTIIIHRIFNMMMPNDIWYAWLNILCQAFGNALSGVVYFVAQIRAVNRAISSIARPIKNKEFGMAMLKTVSEIVYSEHHYLT